MEVVFNFLLLPFRNEMEGESEVEQENDEDHDLLTSHQINMPELLMKIPYLRSITEHGNTFFFICFGTGLLIVVYTDSRSFILTLLCIPALVFLYYIVNLVSILLATLLMRKTTIVNNNQDRGVEN